MSEHPIEGLMTTAMQSIRDMVDVNTIVGDAVEAPDGTIIIPISKVTFGFAAGGGEYANCCSLDGTDTGGNISGGEGDGSGGDKESKYPFAGGSGAGVSINPIAFLVVGHGQVKLLPVYVNSSVNKILDLVPEMMDKLSEMFKKKVPAKDGKDAKDKGTGQNKVSAANGGIGGQNPQNHMENGSGGSCDVNNE